MNRRTILGVLILVIWAGTVGWHVRREYFQPEMTRLALATLTLDPTTNFYSLQMGGQAIGIASSRLDTLPDGFVLDDLMNLDLQGMGESGRVVAETRVELTRTLQMTRFHFSLNGATGAFQANGEVVGDSILLVEVITGESVEEISFRVQEAPLFTAALPMRIAKGGLLEEGRVLRFPVFDPSTVSTRTVEIEVMEMETLTVADSAVFDSVSGRWAAASFTEIEAWRIQERFGGISTESWIDQDGRVIRSSSLMGFSLERIPYELAEQAQRDSRQVAEREGGGSDIIFSTAIASDVDLGEVEQYDELRFVLTGVDLEGFTLEGGRQSMRGDTLVVRRESLSGLDPGYTLPYPRMDLREALEPEPLIQSGDERIVRAARQAAGVRFRGNHSPVLAAQRLTDRVYGMLRKEITFSLPSATQVLETRRGDCNEHTVLFVAMARAIGLPARIAVGLVYLDGSFFYHAWPEVWLGDWVAMDPTFGQTPADAAHLRFVTGGLAQQVEIARLIGTLQIEVILPSQTRTQ